MVREDPDFLIPMFPSRHYANYNILVINQTTEGRTLTSNHPSVRVINSFDKGLSKSRNLALDNARGALCVIIDDDVVFRENFETHIIAAFTMNPAAALITFRAEKTPGVPYRKYPERTKSQVSGLDVLGLMSIEMVLNREVINSGSFRFDENFGLGATFGMGEEAVFAAQLKKAGRTIVMEPKTIVGHAAVSTHNTVSIQDKYFAQGGIFTAVFGDKYYKWLMIKLLFDLKQSQLKLKDVMKAVNAAKEGQKAFIRSN